MRFCALTLAIMSACSMFVSCHEDVVKMPEMQHGDLLFNVVPPRGTEMASAIADVTCDSDEMQISHVAIVCRKGGDVYALEATMKNGVVMTPIDSFIEHADCTADGNPYIILARLNDTIGVAKSVSRAEEYIGKPYDFLYMPDEEEIYCSELVQLSYMDNNGKPVFEQIPMSFHDASGCITDFWKEHYASRNMNVPEGEPGTNPGGILRSPKVKIIRKYY